MLLDSQYNQLTGSIIGCAMEVHRTLGCGFQEVIYQRSLAVEMEKAGLVFGRELEMPLFYKGVDVGSRRVDFLVGDAVLVELKALHELTPTHFAQIINYPKSLIIWKPTNSKWACSSTLASEACALSVSLKVSLTSHRSEQQSSE